MSDDPIKKVAPRDIFNEANFVKNLATLTQAINSGSLPGLGLIYNDIQAESMAQWFHIDPMDGDMVLDPNAIGFHHREEGQQFTLKRGMNSRSAYPTFFEDEEYGIHDIFSDEGELLSNIQSTFEEGPNTPPNTPDAD